MFEHLLKPGKIGNLTIKNRMKYAATVNNFCDWKTGEVTPREIGFLHERAKGGFGIVTSQGGYTHILGKGYVGQMGLDNESQLPGLTKLAAAMKADGAVAIGQVMHTGRYGHAHEYGIHETIAGGKKVSGMPVGPTAMSSPIKRYTPCREMTPEEIDEEIIAHGRAARWLKEAGFDGVEICGIAGYIIANFLSPWTNKRTDKWGGSLEKRARFFLEIVERTRKEVGPDYPILVRLNSTEHNPEGNSDADYIQIAKWLEQASVDFISLSVGWHESTEAAISPEIHTGHWLYLPESWKKAGITVPLGMAYRLNKPEVADKAVADGIIDFWEVCRPGMADPDLAKKVTEQRPEDIIPCHTCNQGCFTYVFTDVLVGCSINPRLNREWDPTYDIRTAEKSKKVMVIGGGPSGMEAARVAALRGHQVTLYEKTNELGGQLKYGAKSPLLYEWVDVINYFSTQLKKGGVKVELGKEATADLINREQPEVLIIATGAKPGSANVEGSDGANVANVFDVLDGKVAVGDKVAVIGGNEIAIQVAEWVADQGKEVTVLEEGKRVGYDINIFNLLAHRRLMAEQKMKTLVSVVVDRITDEGVVVTTAGGREATIEADTVIYAKDLEPVAEIRKQINAGSVPEIYSIGDCTGFRKLYEAIHDGYKVGVKV